MIEANIGDQGQHICDQCDQQFTLKKNLTRHQKTVHEGQSRVDNEARKLAPVDASSECLAPQDFEEHMFNTAPFDLTPLPMSHMFDSYIFWMLLIRATSWTKFDNFLTTFNFLFDVPSS